jgi:hypothetical protein
VYPILMRLADRELLKTAWETGPPAGRLAAEVPARPAPARRGAGRRPRLEGT